jgi:hypothetical protein
MLLTMPVIMVSAERSFSKLKLLKNYLRSNMSQGRLNDFVVWNINRKVLESIDLDTILNDFASINAQMSIFL